MIIAIDGPAASGKGTLGFRIAQELGLPHLDTGLLYRATAFALLEDKKALTDVDAALEAARGLNLERLRFERLRDPIVSEAASIVASNPEVRETLVSLQRAFAAQPGGAVLDGRDIGTIICPDADIKLFVTASLEVRAARHASDLDRLGQTTEFSKIMEDIQRRDDRDKNRSIAPLKPARDAIILDTSELNAEAVFNMALNIIQNRRMQNATMNVG